MTTAENFRDAGTRPVSTVSIAGVAWPAYKVVALVVGLLVFVTVAAATMTAAPAVLTGAGSASAVWIALGRRGSRRG